MIALSSPEEVRKAAAFVEAISKVEADFGFVVDFGTVGDLTANLGDPVTFGPGSRYVVARNSGEPGDLTLGLDG